MLTEAGLVKARAIKKLTTSSLRDSNWKKKNDLYQWYYRNAHLTYLRTFVFGTQEVSGELLDLRNCVILYHGHDPIYFRERVREEMWV